MPEPPASLDPKITREQALAAVPVQAPGVTREPLPDGGARLVCMQPTAKFARLILRMPDAVPRKFDLDSMGLAVFDHCDGKRSVTQIIDVFAVEHGVDVAEAERAVTVFLQTLVRRGLVTIVVPR